ncbi:MAG TPA: 16S rRNA (guanine(527)-N(7))-methyltransferase RsmG [Clostridiaceae bacterium]|nr:16S rRNA (guanine(527)-N(7))-methyltransferase RsmG [Clostridiaceae bacterium]
MIDKRVLNIGLKSYGIEPSVEMGERFDIYLSMLLEWNKKMNLTSITDEGEILVKHFFDSLSCLKSNVIFPGNRVIDIGTGAGFPGLPLKIAMPDIELTLLDSLKKRVLFLTELAYRLGLKVAVIHGRAEDYGSKQGFRENFDIVLSRAVAPMNVLCEYTIPFARLGGFVLCQKGPMVFEEIKDAESAIDILGGNLKDILSTDVYGSDLNHYIAKIQKIKACPKKYPRKAGTAEKNPIK